MKIYPFLLCSISAFRVQKVSGDKSVLLGLKLALYRFSVLFQGRTRIPLMKISYPRKHIAELF
jgi:hypothetical protein